MNVCKNIILTSFFFCLTSCVVMPSVIAEYDETCRIVKKKVELSIEELSSFNQLNCSSNHQCKSQFIGQIMSAVIILPLSAIVSGSIAVVGNTIYWLEEEKECLDN